jgi:predicted Rossmann-fold nucleotide-binding protein
VQDERHYSTLRERIGAIMDACDGALALPGGPGTLTEISFTWNHLLTGAITPRPLILIGPGWKATFDQLYNGLGAYIPIYQRDWVTFAPDVEAAFIQLQDRLAQPR